MNRAVIISDHILSEGEECEFLVRQSEQEIDKGAANLAKAILMVKAKEVSSASKLPFACETLN